MEKKRRRTRRRQVKWDPDLKQFIFLYHGCTSADRASITLPTGQGIDLSKCEPSSDFGRGFYTTIKREQAEEWAKVRVIRSTASPVLAGVVLKFRVLRHDLAGLLSLAFVRGERSHRDYWELVHHCRQNPRGQHPPIFHQFGPTNGWYDVVSGPVAARWKTRIYIPNYDQFSFHTKTGTDLLNDAIHSGAPDFESYVV